MKFLPTYSTCQPKFDRPCDRPQSSRCLVRTGFVVVTETSLTGESLFKGSYIGLGQVAEINHHDLGRDGLEVAQPQGNVRSGRYC
ncbi:hypothetical protein [Microcoleus anatoxicus]|uniref:Uncharacterized protein n=1 Tax=Microcoleus anatoxicus PTRS2 TaxID=2705321 RepID=A0ABU8YQ57_9CYAN